MRSERNPSLIVPKVMRSAPKGSFSTQAASLWNTLPLELKRKMSSASNQQLAHALNNVEKSDIVILMGDLNAQVRSSNENWETVMSNQGLGIMDDNGERFAELCGNHCLVIGGTFFSHLDIHEFTWVSPNGKIRNQIDHIAVSGKWRSSLLDVRNRRGADVYRDHYQDLSASNYRPIENVNPQHRSGWMQRKDK